MSNLYCPECGHKNTFSVHRPNFCSSCGFSFSSASTGSSKNFKKDSTPKDLDEEGSDVLEVPNIPKLDVDISYEGMAKVYKGSDFVVETEDNKNIKPKSERKRRKTRKKE